MSERLGKYMAVEELPQANGLVTRRWKVLGSDDSVLGQIRWYSAWRCYTFWPDGGAVLNATCLADLGQFTREHTEKHKTMRAAGEPK